MKALAIFPAPGGNPASPGPKVLVTSTSTLAKPARGDPTGGKQDIQAGTTAQVEDHLAGMELRQRRRIAAAKAGAQRKAEVGDIARRVFVLADRAAGGVGSAAATRVATACAATQPNGRFRVLRTNRLANALHGKSLVSKDRRLSMES